MGLMSQEECDIGDYVFTKLDEICDGIGKIRVHLSDEDIARIIDDYELSDFWSEYAKGA